VTTIFADMGQTTKRTKVFRKRHQLTCVVCSKTFVAKRRDAKTCSLDCRREKSNRERYGKMAPVEVFEQEIIPDLSEQILRDIPGLECVNCQSRDLSITKEDKYDELDERYRCECSNCHTYSIISIGEKYVQLGISYKPIEP